ncbi:transporter substrate-binding domain-containing protein [Ancylobacter sp. MQZ15Z-1]|uniref:Transporter substrate-binding domain-containing protein n=1 Tax=Ancylobacter mangrovi TaxID=2972472 RepID=A0A9X2T764_9HYPH|nr:transporter substrate-binding domain-containing protein [Ancylobacter mangrovi]MCS0497184.1 transporter substrate-binding domain-containing protein [Ancylobacter mangrovi]
MLTEKERDELAPTGVLRAAINFGNTVLAQRGADGAPTGIAVDLATEFASRTGLGLDIVPFEAAGILFEALKPGAWDIAFLAIDPVREAQIAFTSPYAMIEGTYMVPASSPLRTPRDVDAPGMRVSVGPGSAYDLFLSRTLAHARIVRAPRGGSAAMIDLFVAERLDAAAGVRAWLDAYAAAHPGYRVMEEAFMEIGQAIGVPKGRSHARDLLEAFVTDMKTSGFVAQALARSGQTAKVPPAG